jgi:hypothetical protein
MLARHARDRARDRSLASFLLADASREYSNTRLNTVERRLQFFDGGLVSSRTPGDVCSCGDCNKTPSSRGERICVNAPSIFRVIPFRNLFIAGSRECVQ